MECLLYAGTVLNALHMNLFNLIFKTTLEDLPGGAVVKNPPANAGDMGSIPGPGRSHMPWSN